MRLPIGIVALWAGTIGAIPPGWHLCDGTNGTPDLTDRFVVGAGAGLDPRDTGGAATHNHTVSTFGHTHTLPMGTHFAAGTDYHHVTSETAPNGWASPENHLPPYYALAYIMRI